ncbi:MAG: hypothetical protein J1F29_01015 [Lentimicrobiaceae bacterium]|nr:hypothetical protein [Lentimicrobiaceae bacterium]
MLIIMLMLSLSMLVIAQPDIRSDNPIDLAKVAVEKHQKELLDKMQRRLKDRNESKVKDFDKLKENQQFLYHEDSIDFVLKPKSHSLKDIFEKLCDKSNIPTALDYEGIFIDGISYKTVEAGKKQGQIDSTTLMVPVSFKTHTVTKDKKSDVRYTTTFTWEVQVEPKIIKGVKVQGNGLKGYGVKKLTLISSVSMPTEIPVVKPDRENKTQGQKVVTDTTESTSIGLANVVDTVALTIDDTEEMRSNNARTVVKDLAKQLAIYVSSQEAEQRTVIENMFVSTDSHVEVSFLLKDGTEKIKRESVRQYLDLLRGSVLSMTVDNFEVLNSDWNSLVYIVNQRYQSETYSDYTQKRIYLEYDATKGIYVINKIEVIPNSTKIE